MHRPPVAPEFRRPAFLVALLLVLVVAVGARATSASAQSSTRVVPQSLRVRAMGDGMTAGFGNDAAGSLVPVSQRSACTPSGEVPVGRCSSNSRLGPGASANAPAFSADFGLANGVSWAAQVARTLGAIDYANYAVSGSTLVNWMNLPHDDAAPNEGSLHGLLDRIASDDPDLVLVSLGGSILLQLPGGPGLSCAVFRDQITQGTQFESCISAVLDRTLVKQRLMAISFDVLAKTLNAKIVFTSYMTPSPVVSFLDGWQLDVMTAQVNRQINDAVDAVRESGAAWASRIAVANPVVAATEDECVATPRSGFLRLSTASMIRGCPLFDPRFTPASLGTVPTAATQTTVADGALAVIGANGWG